MYARYIHITQLYSLEMGFSVVCDSTPCDIESTFGLAADQLSCVGCHSAGVCHACNEHLALQMWVACLDGQLHRNSAYHPPPTPRVHV
jgi:hypothetical protein